MAADWRMLDHLKVVQNGVFARRQLLEHGLTENDIERYLRRRDLRRVRPGVYVNHTGPLTEVQREWVAVLDHWPAALSHESALPGRRPDAIHVSVAANRNVAARTGEVVHLLAHLGERVDWRSSPPRVRVTHAVIDVMSQRIRRDDVAGAYAALAEACHRRTSPQRVAHALAARERVAGRTLIEGMLSDLDLGVCSVLERGYLQRVERPHGLPRAARQHFSTATGARTEQDVRYEKYGVVVELDGRAVHDNPRAWDADARRDLAELATSDVITARVTYGLVFGGQCATARWIGQILVRQGWDGAVQRCRWCPPTA